MPLLHKKKGGQSARPSIHAYWMRTQVTARPPYGGMRLPLEIGAVVVGFPSTFHTPLSGHVSPVCARVPIGFLARLAMIAALSLLLVTVE